MHLNCPHCRNPIEIVETSAEEVLCPSCGSSFHITGNKTTAEYRPVEHGQMFGRFVVKEKVGMGAFGTVYKAIDGDLHRTVAVKVPRAGNVGSSADGIDRFLREARSAAQLRHPSIVTVHEVGVQNDQPYLVSDFVDGVTLADWLTAHEPTFRQAAQWIADLADALHYAHTQGVIHRDVKPSNIMLQSGEAANPSPLSPGGRGVGGEGVSSRGAAHHLYLMDFGLAKRDAGEITMTIEGQVLGTPAYMSPEQAKGQGHEVDGRADEYSLGVIFYELLTGELPFRGNARMLLHQVLHEEPKAPCKIYDRIPLDLETICLKAMAKEPGRRYADCAQLSADLKRYLNGEPISARPVGNVERAWRWCKRNPVVAGLTAGIAAMLVVATLISSGLAFWALDEKGRANENAKKADDSALAAGKSAYDAKLRAEEAVEEKRRAERLLALQANREGFRLIETGNRFDGLHWLTQSIMVAGNQPEVERMARERLGAYRGLELSRSYLQQVFLHQDSVVIDFSPDGRRVVTASEDKTARVWDTATGEPVTPPLAHQAEVINASFSPDGRRIVTASEDKTARVWDASTGQPVTPPLTHQAEVIYAFFSPDGRRIVTTSWDKTARVWDAGTGQPVTSPLLHQDRVNQASFSPDGRRVITGSDDMTARVWDAATGQPVTPPLAHLDRVIKASFSPDNRRVVTASWDRTARVWDATTGQPITPPLSHRNLVNYASFSPDGRRVVTASGDKTARVWDAATGQPVTPPLAHEDRVNHASFSPDGRRVVTASGDKTARVWNAATGQPVTPFLTHQNLVVHAKFRPDSRRVVTVSWDKSARMWDTATGQPVTPFLTHHNIVFHAEFSSDGRRVVTASEDKTARVWDAATGQPITPPLLHQDSVNHASFSPDGRRVVTASGDKTARVWDAATGQPVTPPLAHEDRVNHASFSPDGRRVATASYDKMARVWDAATGQPISPPLLHQDTVNHASFSPDSRRVVTASTDKTARVWDVATGQPITPPLLHQDRVNHASFSPDGRRVVTASSDKTARVWDATTGQPVTPPLSHQDGVLHASYSPDGRRVVAASFDNTARVWDADTGQPVTPPLSHQDIVYHASFSPDGRRVVTASADKTAQIWELPIDTRPTKDLLRLAQVYASHKIDDTGGLQPLDVEKELIPWHKDLKAKYPEEFIPKYEDTRRWRLQQIADSAKERNLPAALFHQNWLLAEAVQEAAKQKK